MKPGMPAGPVQHSSGNGAPNGTYTSGDATNPPPGDAPALNPKLLALTYVGGPGRQYVREVGFSDSGEIIGKGSGFSVVYDAQAAAGRTEGNVAEDDSKSFTFMPDPVGSPGRPLPDPRHNLTYFVGFRQATATLQIPILRAKPSANVDADPVWKLWGWSGQAIIDRQLAADTRAYDVWLMPNGKIGVKAENHGGNTVLSKNPVVNNGSTDEPIAVTAGSFQAGPSPTSNLFLLVDPTNGTPLSGTFLRAQVSYQAVDAWGRVYLPRFIEGAPTTNPFGAPEAAGVGLFVLNPQLTQPVFSARLGGTCTGEGRQQAIRGIAIRGNLLVVGGTTCATDLPTTSNAVQAQAGGDQDGLFAIIQLW